MSMYGIPEKLITLVKAIMYSNFECAVLEEGKTTEWLGVQSARVYHVGLCFPAINCLGHE